MTAPRQKLTAEMKARALEIWGAEDGGTAKAAKFAKVTPRTVNRWAADAGLSSPEERRERTEMARLATLRRQTEAFERLIPQLTHIAERSLSAQLELTSLANEVLAKTREGAEITVELTARLRAAALLTEVIPARVLVAMSTRAVHDLQLLTGGDTERAAGEVKVYLAQLPQIEGGSPTIIDVTPAGGVIASQAS